MFMSGPWPTPRQRCLTTTRSAASMNLIGANASASHASRSCSYERMSASRPTKGAGLPVGGAALPNDHVATRLVKLIKLDTVRLPRVLDSHALTKPGFPTSGDFAVWPVFWRHNHHVRVVKRDKRRQVAFIPQLDL